MQPGTALQLDQLCAGQQYAQPVRPEVDEDDVLIFEADDPAEAVLVVCHQVAHGERLDWVLDYRDIEGTTWQLAPRRPGA